MVNASDTPVRSVGLDHVADGTQPRLATAPASKAVVLIDTYPGQTDRVLRELEEFPQVVAKRRVSDGVIDIALRIQAQDREEALHFISTTLRFLAGVRTVEEVQDAEEYHLPVREAIQALRV